MVYETFLNTVRVLVQEKLGDSVEVRPVKVLKNNGTVCDGLTIVSGTYPVSPTVYLNDLYELYREGMPMHVIAEQVLRASAAGPEIPPDTADRFCDYSSVKEQLAFRLINTEENRELLEDVPWFPVLDLAMVFISVVHTAGGELYSCLIRRNHLDIWNISPEELRRDALENAPKVLPARLRTMAEAMQLENADEMPFSPLYVLTNGTGIQGASAMLYPGVLKNLADKVDDDLVILPSSIHEVLLMPEKDSGEAEHMNRMVREVNRSSVDRADRLSDHIYYFRREGCLITVPQGSCLASESTITIPSAMAPAI